MCASSMAASDTKMSRAPIQGHRNQRGILPGAWGTALAVLADVEP